MKAIGLYSALPIEDAQALIEQDVPRPSIGDEDLLVRVEAISVNPVDWRVRKRKVDDGQFQVLGWDVAGEVVEVGALVKGFDVGDSVYYAGDLTRPGANSEFHAVDAAIVGHRPASLSAAEAAALPLTVLTAWEALFEGLGIPFDGTRVERTLLIVGGAGGVGSIAIQLACLVPGLTVIATASRQESQDWCKTLGAHAVIDHFSDMATQLQTLGKDSPDFVLLINAPDHHWSMVTELLAPQGAICSIVSFDHAVDFNPIMLKSARFSWEFMFTRSMFNTNDKTRQREILDHTATLIDEGKLRSTVTQSLGTINAANLRKAHAQLESGRMIGKLVLSGFDAD
ncbi:zinc-binding alcohol dehydrogenase family protein [Pseudomonas aeruginosa]|uniref:zinc-binding alcohol dehydrogenase family protein n=1 Tax=Pseudomonas aeruginosa TaxID=287 RepID=UPI00053E2AC9|nr:zinc-binding alcohol dehydrogenase family protein [Pseudomonas aeruginosa]EME5141347.1 zinc-binding alcohol dehydrogenase family protein [Pseudomonas aeruginosa]HCF3395415.1 zinc-binding alcohol dehydrogenase family protein [Pseudomonas aeruginosa]